MWYWYKCDSKLIHFKVLKCKCCLVKHIFTIKLVIFHSNLFWYRKLWTFPKLHMQNESLCKDKNIWSTGKWKIIFVGLQENIKHVMGVLTNRIHIVCYNYCIIKVFIGKFNRMYWKVSCFLQHRKNPTILTKHEIV